jgi:hypothetical protein
MSTVSSFRFCTCFVMACDRDLLDAFWPRAGQRRTRHVSTRSQLRLPIQQSTPAAAKYVADAHIICDAIKLHCGRCSTGGTNLHSVARACPCVAALFFAPLALCFIQDTLLLYQDLFAIHVVFTAKQTSCCECNACRSARCHFHPNL